MPEEIIQLIKGISWAGVGALLILALWKTGVFQSVASYFEKHTPQETRIKKVESKAANSQGRISASENIMIDSSQRLQVLEDFKAEAEQNHWHDIEELKKAIAEVKFEQRRQGERISFLYGHLSIKE